MASCTTAKERLHQKLEWGAYRYTDSPLFFPHEMHRTAKVGGKHPSSVIRTPRSQPRTSRETGIKGASKIPRFARIFINFSFSFLFFFLPRLNIFFFQQREYYTINIILYLICNSFAEQCPHTYELFYVYIYIRGRICNGNVHPPRRYR